VTGDARKPLKIQPLFHRSWHLNKSFEYKVSKIPWGVPKPPQGAAGAQRTIKADFSLRPCGVLRRFDVKILVVLI